jgi:hypothetical protein
MVCALLHVTPSNEGLHVAAAASRCPAGVVVVTTLCVYPCVGVLV